MQKEVQLAACLILAQEAPTVPSGFLEALCKRFAEDGLEDILLPAGAPSCTPHTLDASKAPSVLHMAFKCPKSGAVGASSRDEMRSHRWRPMCDQALTQTPAQ